MKGADWKMSQLMPNCHFLCWYTRKKDAIRMHIILFVAVNYTSNLVLIYKPMQPFLPACNAELE